jgi:hypothetical protein
MHDSPQWRKFLQEHPHFLSEAADLVMWATDGFNPFKGSKRSCWPHLFKVLNLQPNAIGKAENIIVAGISHGPKAPVSFRGVIRLINEELTKMGRGRKCIHPVTQAEAVRYGALFCHGADYPALQKMNEQAIQGAYSACMGCWIHGENCLHLQRMTYTLDPEDLPPPKTMEQVGYCLFSACLFLSVWFILLVSHRPSFFRSFRLSAPDWSPSSSSVHSHASQAKGMGCMGYPSCLWDQGTLA